MEIPQMEALRNNNEDNIISRLCRGIPLQGRLNIEEVSTRSAAALALDQPDATPAE
jgi:hypothetical protein